MHSNKVISPKYMLLHWSPIGIFAAMLKGSSNIIDGPWEPGQERMEKVGAFRDADNVLTKALEDRIKVKMREQIGELGCQPTHLPP